VTERVFRDPGARAAHLDAGGSCAGLPVGIQGVVMRSAFVMCWSTCAIDSSYNVLDPRIRY